MVDWDDKHHNGEVCIHFWLFNLAEFNYILYLR